MSSPETAMNGWTHFPSCNFSLIFCRKFTEFSAQHIKDSWESFIGKFLDVFVPSTVTVFFYVGITKP